MSRDQITINNLSKVYDNGFEALKKINLNIKKGEILGFYYDLKGNQLKIVNYFNDFEDYLSKTTLKSFTKSVINHKF